MAAEFKEFIRRLQIAPKIEDFEPELDDKNEAKDLELREQQDLNRGVVMRGSIVPGDGKHSPVDGDLRAQVLSAPPAHVFNPDGPQVTSALAAQVTVHVVARSPDGQNLWSTQEQFGGSGLPLAFVMGKGRRVLRGWELALYDMTKGERSLLQIKPVYAYGHRLCQLPAPPGVDPKATLHFDMELLQIYPKDVVRLVGRDQDLIKLIKREADVWESPRPPFEVKVQCRVKEPAASGVLGAGRLLWQTEADEPLEFKMGAGAVPAGIEEAVGSTVKGEQSVIVCPIELLEQGKNSLELKPKTKADRVELELELLSYTQIRDLTGTGEVTKKRLREGEGQFPVDCPVEDCPVQVHIRAFRAGMSDPFLDTRGPDGAGEPLAFDTAMGVVPEAVDLAVRLMCVKEVSLIESNSRYAYDGRPDRPPDLPEGAAVDFEVELISFERQPHWQNEEPDKKIRHAGRLKDLGNQAFKAGQNRFAKPKWERAIRLMDRLLDAETEEQIRASSDIKVACLTNLALCCQREQKFGEALTWCEKALREQPDLGKAYWRRAHAHAPLGNWDNAFADLETCKEKDPGMAKDVEAEILKFQHQQRSASARQKAQFGKFFK